MSHELLLSERDIQFLVGMHALVTTMIAPSATEAEAEQNFLSLMELLSEAYSTDEVNVLGRRLRAALPADTIVSYTEQDDDTLLPPSSGLVS